MEALAGLALLACPLGMGLMMVLMSKGMRAKRTAVDADSVVDLRAEHARLGRAIARLQGDDDGARARVEVSR